MEFIMAQQIQNISDELYDLCDKIKTQKEVDLLLKEIQDNGLDLCSVKGIFSHSMLGSFILKDVENKLLLNTLFKKNILNDLETPSELISPWIPAASLSARKINDKILKQLGNIDTNDINKWYQSTGLGDGHTLSALLIQFQHSHSKREFHSGLVKYFSDDKLIRLTNGPLKTLLDFGLDVNIMKESNHSKYHPLHYILGSQNYIPSGYMNFLNVVLQHGFDFNNIYNKSNQNNYIQHLFNSLSERSMHQCNMGATEIVKIMHKLVEYKDIDFDYKNEKGKTVSDIIEIHMHHFNAEDKAFFEQLILNKSITTKPVLTNKSRL